jgi:hypothetical protein
MTAAAGVYHVPPGDLAMSLCAVVAQPIENITALHCAPHAPACALP